MLRAGSEQLLQVYEVKVGIDGGQPLCYVLTNVLMQCGRVPYNVQQDGR